jgi:hypothetical protein
MVWAETESVIDYNPFFLSQSLNESSRGNDSLSRWRLAARFRIESSTCRQLFPAISQPVRQVLLVPTAVIFERLKRSIISIVQNGLIGVDE